MFRHILSWFAVGLLAVSFACFVLLTTPENQLARPRPPAHAQEAPLVVVLDPGHGGQDSGAMCGALMEKDLTLDVALRAQQLLRGAGYTTVLTRDSDRYLSLAERAAVANHEKNSLFVSIHFNDGERAGASGVETYFAAQQSAANTGILGWFSFLPHTEAKPIGAQSESLAAFLQAALVERTRAVDRGIKSEQFYVIAKVRHPSALVEGGFITNPGDVMKLATTGYRQRIASAICDGIRRYREVVPPNEPTLAWAAPAK